MKNNICFALLCATLLLTQRVAADPVVVSSMDELRKAIKKATPDTVIVVANGEYELQKDLELKRLKGDAEHPVTIRAEHDLKVVLRGGHAVKLRDSEYFVLRGFRFELRTVQGKSGAVNVRNCRHCRITRNEFKLDESDGADGNQTWLTLDGKTTGHNRIDHNRFSDKNQEGYFVFITGEGDYVSQHDLIERNHFADLAYGNDENGFETIRVGESRIGNVGGKSSTMIRENLFERCHGEDEMVSFKVGGGSFIGNTVVNCHGSVVFRDGNDGVFSNNIVLNTYAERPFDDFRGGGVRFYGSGHRIFNNYFSGLDGTSLKAPLAVMHGAPAGSGALGGADGLPATNCEIVHNTWVRCSQLRLGHASEKRPLKPEGCTFANNIVCETEDDRLLGFYEAEGVACRGNIVYATGSKETGIEGMDLAEAAFQVVDPKLEESNGIHRLSADSPAVNAALQSVSYVAKDMDGQARDKKPDVGADEYSNSGDQQRRPLTAKDVGP